MRNLNRRAPPRRDPSCAVHSDRSPKRVSRRSHSLPLPPSPRHSAAGHSARKLSHANVTLTAYGIAYARPETHARAPLSASLIDRMVRSGFALAAHVPTRLREQLRPPLNLCPQESRAAQMPDDFP